MNPAPIVPSKPRKLTWMGDGRGTRIRGRQNCVLSRQIDQHVHLVAVNLARSVVVSGVTQVNKAVECSFEPVPQRAGIVRAIRIPKDLKPCPVMSLDDLGDHPGYRVVAKIRREVPEPDLARRARASMNETGGRILCNYLAPLLRAE